MLFLTNIIKHVPESICYCVFGRLCRGRGHWAVYYTIPQSFMIPFFIRWLIIFGNFYWTYISWFIQLRVQTFQIIFVLFNRRGNFVYHHWGCTSIYRPVSYTFRSLILHLIIQFVNEFDKCIVQFNVNMLSYLRYKNFRNHNNEAHY